MNAKADEMTITTGIVLTNPDEWIKDIPPAQMISTDRKGGWMVRYPPFHTEWIKAIENRGLADQILEAFVNIETGLRAAIASSQTHVLKTKIAK